jgi:type IV secretory pathway VirB2 component (pilin)
MNISPAWRKHFLVIQDSKAIFLLLLLVPAAAHAQAAGGSPFDTGFSAMQNLFTGTVAKVASLIAIVVGGYQFAHGEPGAKKSAAIPVFSPNRIREGLHESRRPHRSEAGTLDGDCHLCIP